AEHEDRIRQVQIVVGRRGQALEPADGVVAQVAHRAAAEARQARQRHRLVLLQQLRELLDGTARERLVAALAHQLAELPASGGDERRSAAEQRVAAPLLAALDALEQEAVAAVVDLAER